MSTPEILERVYSVESEILQIEEAIAIQSNNNIGLSAVSNIFRGFIFYIYHRDYVCMLFFFLLTGRRKSTKTFGKLRRYC